jgi:hypothetical protein
MTLHLTEILLELNESFLLPVNSRSQCAAIADQWDCVVWMFKNHYRPDLEDHQSISSTSRTIIYRTFLDMSRLAMYLPAQSGAREGFAQTSHTVETREKC